MGQPLAVLVVGGVLGPAAGAGEYRTPRYCRFRVIMRFSKPDPSRTPTISVSDTVAVRSIGSKPWELIATDTVGGA